MTNNNEIINLIKTSLPMIIMMFNSNNNNNNNANNNQYNQIIVLIITMFVPLMIEYGIKQYNKYMYYAKPSIILDSNEPYMYMSEFITLLINDKLKIKRVNYIDRSFESNISTVKNNIYEPGANVYPSNNIITINMVEDKIIDNMKLKLATIPFDISSIENEIFEVHVTEETIANGKRSNKYTKITIEGSSMNKLTLFVKLILFYQTNKLNNYIFNYQYNYVDNQMQYISNVVNVNKTFSNIFLSKENHQLITTNKINWSTNKQELLNLGLPLKHTYLLFGEPGCGKTSCIFAMSQELKMNIININFDNHDNISFGKMMSKISNSIIVIDDADSHEFLLDRTKKNDNINMLDLLLFKKINGNDNDDNNKDDDDEDENEDKKDQIGATSKYPKIKITLSKMLEVLDGYIYLNNCIMFITTNHIDKLDPAVVRPGRIDFKIEFKLYNTYQFKKMFKYYTKKSYKDVDSQFVFVDYVISTSSLSNEYILPNINNPEKILSLLNTFFMSKPSE